MNNNNVKKHTTVRISEEIYKKIETLSKKEERTISSQINYILKDWLKIKEI